MLFENENFIVVHKHQAHSFHCHSAAIGFFEHCKQRLQLANLYPVHRLDTGTTGLMIFAKNKATASALGTAFANSQIQKFYLGVALHKPKHKQGCIIGDMLKARNGSYKLSKTRQQPAITQFYSQAFYPDNALPAAPAARALLLAPSTGKTHQLRVAMQALGAPLAGDLRYGKASAPRLYLHAYQLGFSLFGEDFLLQARPQHGELFLATQFQALLNEQWRHPQNLQWRHFGNSKLR